MSHDFFNIISREEFESLLASFSATDAVQVPISDAFGLVLAADIISPEDLPPANRSCMDGYAVNARDAFGATEANPAYLECCAELKVDENPDFTLKSGECAAIATGGTLPEGADAVVMVEHTHELGSGTIEIRKSSAPGEHAMLKGEDAAKGDTVFRAGHKVRFQDVGLLAALGIKNVSIHKKPRTGIISTGDELVKIDSPQKVGTIRDVNSHTLRCLVSEAGAEPVNYGIVRDELEKLKSTLKQAVAENDLVLLSGGSSVGMRDLTVQAIESMDDSEILAHGVAISPGKPTILGRVGGKPVLGLPGQVTSVQVVMLSLVMPFIRHIMGQKNAFSTAARPLVQAELGRNAPSKQGREDYVRMKLIQRENEIPLAQPVYGKSGLLKTMVQADGLMIIPADTEGLYAGDTVSIWLI
ncbi:gephyrin-like molybdotransferase Glp [Maridesulfovibrio hydrothermalis]|uniref:Molybdopterin molybdenumtransferase n=1 Tax=Maridesulfovibrio hydrothermalis AM13 = DSM 14728 TaxID=1121451 RepID=L0R803_9BACT|nr:gephyrin-like molybdotransferase Glp [Maridesulfovibrio hydrothermalis]CCO22362.1 Molybdenum cofactor synthesis domain protein [Maridesulfovibrio hydrothermalis AM13 = DSM 14728]